MKFKRVTSMILLILFLSLILSGIFIIFSTSRELRATLSAAAQSQAEFISSPILSAIARLDEEHRFGETGLKPFSDSLTERCQQLSAQYQEKGVAHIAIINPDGEFLAHSDSQYVGQNIRNIRSSSGSLSMHDLGWRKIVTARDAVMYHYLIPAVSDDDRYFATIDIAFFRVHQDAPVQQFWMKGLIALGKGLLLLLPVIAVVLYYVIARPVRYLIRIGERMSQGHTINFVHLTARSDELARLGTVLVNLSKYIQEVTELATQIASGHLKQQSVQKRSARDILGYALQEMLAYLQTLAMVATNISEGDLSMTIPIRSDIDAFGKSLHKMMTYLQEMADVATTISTGDLRKRAHPRSERDVLGAAFSNMTGYLRRLSTTATAIAAGDLQQEVCPASEHDVLGNAFHSMTVQLRENFEKIQQEVAERTRAQEELQQLNEELEQRVEERTAEIARQKYILDSFMANVPDSIYFKDRDCRIIQGNKAYSDLLNVDEPDQMIGKSDFDFFPEKQAQSKYDQEQQIIRTGKPLLDLEESDAGGRWVLTTKMPLRDEHGEIIGTFGVSRDITEMKNAQQQLEEANAEIQMLNKRLQTENLRMKTELDVAQRLQKMVLPPAEELQQIEGLEVVGFMRPADEVGGDYYEVLTDERGKLCLGIGDVTGHGLESGVLMVMAQAAVRTLVERGEHDPVVFLNTLNRVLHHNIERMRSDKSMTLAIMKYADNGLTLFGQHEEILVVRRDGAVERIDTADLGFPLGLEDDITPWINETTIRLDAGDGVVLYTDGITEAENAENQLYGIERLCRVVSQNWSQPALSIQQRIIDDVIRYIGDQTIHDDLTLVVLKQL